MPEPSEETQDINIQGLYPTDLSLDPAYTRHLTLSSHIQRTLPLLSGWTGSRQELLRCNNAGYLRTAQVGGGYDTYDSKTGTQGNTFTTLTMDDTANEVEIIIEDNEAKVQISNDGGTSFGDDVRLPIGGYTLPITVDQIKVKSTSASTDTKYSITGWW